MEELAISSLETLREIIKKHDSVSGGDDPTKIKRRRYNVSHVLGAGGDIGFRISIESSFSHTCELCEIEAYPNEWPELILTVTEPLRDFMRKLVFNDEFNFDAGDDPSKLLNIIDKLAEKGEQIDNEYRSQLKARQTQARRAGAMGAAARWGKTRKHP
jgi:hypothetical protein